MGGDHDTNEPSALQPAAPPGLPAKRRRRRWPWVLLAFLLILPFALRAALPSIIERGTAYASRYWLGLPVRIDDVRLALLDGRVLLEGVTIGSVPDHVTPRDAALHPPAIDADSSLLHLDRISAHLSWEALRDHKLRLTELTVDAPRVRLARESDGAIDPLRHATPAAPESPATEPEPEAEPAKPWPIEVEHFALRAPDWQIIDAASKDSLLNFSLETFALTDVGVNAGAFALGGVDIEGPVLRLRRDLVVRKAAGGPATVTTGAISPPKSASPPAQGASTSSPQPAQDAAEATSSQAAPAASPGLPAAPAASQAVPAAPAAAAPPAPAGSGYRIEKIDIARATFTWVTEQGPLDVALSLKASNVTGDEGQRFPVDLQLEIGSGSIGLAGDVGILPPAYTGTIKWSGLPFPPLLLASLPEIAAWLHSADSTGDLTLDADIAGVKGAPALRMSGRAAIDTLAVSNPGTEEVSLGWKQLEVQMKELVVPLPENDEPARTTVAKLDLVRLTEPKIRYTHPSPALNAILGIPAPAPATGVGADKPLAPVPANTAKAVPPAAKEEPKPAKGVLPAPSNAAPARSAAPVDVTVANLELRSGDMQLVDTTVTPAVTSYLKDLDVSASDFHFPDPSAENIRLRATLPTASSLAIDGKLEAGNNGDFTITLKQLDLPVFSPYAAAGGATLDAGEASVTTKLKMRGTTMQVDNDLVLRRFGVSLRDPDSFNREFGMPLDLALALLRDPAGDIRLNIPVKVDDRGASVSMGAVIASALKAALVGAVTAPLKMLGAAFGGPGGGAGGLAITPIASQAGVADLAPDAPARADSLAKLLKQRPGMALVLSGRTGEADRPLLAEQLLAEQLEAGKGLPDVEGSSFLARRRIGKVLETRDNAPELRRSPPSDLSTEDRQLFDRYIAATKVPAERYDALAKTRAENARDLLVARSVDPARIKIGSRAAEGDPAVSIAFATSSEAAARRPVKVLQKAAAAGNRALPSKPAKRAVAPAPAKQR